MEEMDGSTYNLVTGTLRPSKSRIITGMLVTFVALLLVLSVTFIVLYIHEKNTGDANVGNSSGAGKVVNVPTTSGKTFRHSKIDKVCYNKSCIVAAGGMVALLCLIMFILPVNIKLLVTKIYY